MNSITLSEERDEEASYGYCDDYQPHAVRRMFDSKHRMLYDMRWDKAGNLGQVSIARPGDMFETGRFLFWTEDCCGPRPCGANRMHVAADDKFYSYYNYDHSGERRLKLIGRNDLLDVNADIMATYTLLNEPTLYPSAYMVLNNKGYTKHYYAGTERVAARIGGGGLDALGHDIGNEEELLGKANMLFMQSLDQVNHRKLDENDIGCIRDGELVKEELALPIGGIPHRMQAEVMVNHEQIRYVVRSMQDDPNEGKEKDVYFYHSDHLGSASWITDATGTPVQHLQYLPYGEPFVNQRAAGYSERFTFTGKERDEETGYSYFGARYMDHELMTMWLSVDPLADKYPSISPYAYCAWNPVKLVDPNGMIIDSATMNSEIKELLNPQSKKYNGDFASVIQKLSDDPATLYRFCVWDEPCYDENGSRVINGELQCAGKNEGIWVVDICYVSEGDRKHRRLFEETYHAFQLLTGDIGCAYTTNGYGLIGVDDNDEIKAKNWAYNISRGSFRKFLGWEYSWTIEDLRRDGYAKRSSQTAYDVYNDYLKKNPNSRRRGFDENGWIESDDFHFKIKQ